MIGELCRKHTALSDADIRKVEEVARTIPSVADLMGADIFIDCLTRDRDTAIVVAQARPGNRASLYKGSVIGEYAFRKNEPAVLRTLEIGMPTRDMRATTQENLTVSQNVSPIKNDDGQVVGVLIAEKDVTEHVHARKSLSVLSRTTEQLMEALIDSRQREHSLPYHVTDGIVMFNNLGKSIYVNPVAEQIYRKLGFQDLLEWNDFENLSIVDVVFQNILEKKQVCIRDAKVGGLMLSIKYAVMKNRERKNTGIVMLIRDETDAKAKEKELILKSVAIREIHHRVKNNLQTIASLLRLQSRRIDDEVAKTAFGESISRVLSIAATHEILAQNGVDDVDIRTMLLRIKTGIADHALYSNKEILITVEGDTFMCNSDMATSIALVVNEAIQNCLKYAFPGRDKGSIRIEIGKGESYGNISITDDGVGFDVKQVSYTALGFRIVDSIVRDKLQGTLNAESGDAGTKVFFDFPLEDGVHITEASCRCAEEQAKAWEKTGTFLSAQL